MSNERERNMETTEEISARYIKLANDCLKHPLPSAASAKAAVEDRTASPLVGSGSLVGGTPASEFLNVSLAGIRVRAKWDSSGWYNILHDADGTRQNHVASLCRCRSQDGIVLYQLILAGLRVVVGRTNQAPNK